MSCNAFPSNSRSALPCGCDEGANHMCAECTERVREYDRQRAVKAYNEAGVDRCSWTPPTGIKDSGERITFASGSMRDPSTGKIKWSRITFGPMLRRWATHLTNAEVKYPDPQPGVPNFMLIKTEEEYQRYKESAFRHFMSWFHDETDEDHASATFFNINGVEIIKDKRKSK